MTSGNNTVGGKDAPEKQFPSLNATYAGWEVSEEDLVNYNDAQRRGLQFLFSVYRKAPSGVIDSPMNKFVSVYQKNEDGDFVIVSVSGNNPNDIRLMEMTNEYYGDPDPDPMLLVMKTIEMADDSGMLRPDGTYGSYGMLETADGAALNNFNQDVGKEPTPQPTASKITAAASTSPKAASRINNLAGVLVSSFMSTSAGARSTTVGGANVIKRSWNAMFAKNKGATAAATLDVKHSNKIAEIKAAGDERVRAIAAKGMFDRDITGMKNKSSEKIARTVTRSREDVAMIPEQVFNKRMAQNKAASDLVSGFSTPEKHNLQKSTIAAAYSSKPVPVPQKPVSTTFGTAPVPGAPSTPEKFSTVTNKLGPTPSSGVSPNVSTSFKTTMQKPAKLPKAPAPGMIAPSSVTYTAPKMTNKFSPAKSRAGQVKPTKSKYK